MKITASTTISSRPKKVFPWVADPKKAMKWQKDVKGGEILKETPGQIGTTFKEIVEQDGKSLEMYGEITNFVQDELISFHLESKIHSFDVDYVIEGMADKSVFTIDLRIRWKFPMNIVTLFLGPRIKRGILEQTRSELAKLKKLCEM